MAENYLRKKRIAIVVNAYNEIGTSHIDRCLAMASKLVFHEVLFLVNEHRQLGIDILSKVNYAFRTYDNSRDLFKILSEYQPHIVVNDILDTSEEYISALKEEGYFVVNFEDLGVGGKLADVVFDDLYEHELGELNVYTGHNYFMLNDEFHYQPAKIITNDVNRVLINFGEVDPHNLTEKVIESIISTNYEGRIDVIVGLAYDKLEELISKYESNPLIQIYKGVSNISEFMFKADIIFASANKSIYEICSLGIPTICLCQDEREESHAFVTLNNGFINLGLGEFVEKEELTQEFIKIVNDYELRRELHEKMLAIDLRYGFENITSVVEREYRKFEFNKRLKKDE